MGSVTTGYGDGCGYGYDGGGYGGYGDGCGYGGCGYGYGDGYGDGDGDGYGDGCGYGYGYDGGYWNAILAERAAQHPDRQLAFWRSGGDGRPSNGGAGVIAEIGAVHEVEGPVRLCGHGLHATHDPTEWSGDAIWLVALDGEIVRGKDKLVASRRTILERLV